MSWTQMNIPCSKENDKRGSADAHLQEDDCQDVRCSPGHRYDIGPQGVRWQLCTYV